MIWSTIEKQQSISFHHASLVHEMLQSKFRVFPKRLTASGVEVYYVERLLLLLVDLRTVVSDRHQVRIFSFYWVLSVLFQAVRAVVGEDGGTMRDSRVVIAGRDAGFASLWVIWTRSATSVAHAFCSDSDVFISFAGLILLGTGRLSAAGLSRIGIAGLVSRGVDLVLLEILIASGEVPILCLYFAHVVQTFISVEGLAK